MSSITDLAEQVPGYTTLEGLAFPLVEAFGVSPVNS